MGCPSTTLAWPDPLVVADSQGSEHNKKLASELSTEAAQTAALQTDLQMKQQQLQRHENLMKNLQICLAHGPDALAQSPAPAPFSALETKAESKCGVGQWPAALQPASES